MKLFPESVIVRKIKSGQTWPDNSSFFQDYYHSMEGRRDGWAWFYGLGSPILFLIVAVYEYSTLKAHGAPASALEAFVESDVVSLAIILIACIPFFFGQAWARKAMYLVPVGTIFAFNTIMDGVLTSAARSQATADMIAHAFWGILVYAAITSSSIPNKAFFRLPYDEDKVEKYWKAISNKYARYAVYAAFLMPLIVGIFGFPLTSLDIVERGSATAKGIGVISLIVGFGIVMRLSVIAWKRHAPEAVPPIGGRGFAIFAVLLVIAWFGFFLFVSFHE